MSVMGRERKVAKAQKPVTFALRYEVAMKVLVIALIIIGAAIAASSLPTVFRNEGANVETGWGQVAFALAMSLITLGALLTFLAFRGGKPKR